MKTSEKSVAFSSRVSLKRVKQDQIMESSGNDIDMIDSSVATKRQSPFRTPLSSSYCHEKVNEHICATSVRFFLSDDL